MIDFIRQAPFIRIILPFILGIVLSLFYTLPPIFIILLILVTFVLLFGSVILNKRFRSINFQWLFGLLISIIILFSGIILTSLRLNSIKPKIKNPNESVFICSIEDSPVRKEKTVRCIVNIKSCYTDDTTININQGAIAYFQKSTYSGLLSIGDDVVIKTKACQLKGYGNPFEFDYKKYFERQNIYYQLYIDSTSWMTINKDNTASFNKFIASVRQKIVKVLHKSGLKGNELAVASSLTIGYKVDLNEDIKQAFSSTGTIHILAVSGMHVGLIYVILCFTFGFCDKFKYGKFAKAVIIIILIWIYAIITGLAPSVLRATIMFTFISFGILTRRSLNTFNSLSISAFFILLYDPLQITEIGFQLSYFAVIGIITIYPLIYNRLKTGNKFFDPILALLTVSFSAQLGTSPLSLFYFHQFPNYFLLSNLIIVPLSSMIIYSSVFVFLFTGWDSISFFIGKIYNFLISTLNNIVFWFDNLPFATTKNIILHPIEVILLYISILLGFSAFIKRKPSLLIGFLLSINILFLSGIIKLYIESKTNKVIVFNTQKNMLLQFKCGLKNIWITDELNELNKKIIKNSQLNALNNNYLILESDSFSNKFYLKKHLKNCPIAINNRMIKFYNTIFAIGYNDSINPTVAIDYLLVQNKDYNYYNNLSMLNIRQKIIYFNRLSIKNCNSIEYKGNNIFAAAEKSSHYLKEQGPLEISISNNKN